MHLQGWLMRQRFGSTDGRLQSSDQKAGDQRAKPDLPAGAILPSCRLQFQLLTSNCSGSSIMLHADDATLPLVQALESVGSSLRGSSSSKCLHFMPQIGRKSCRQIWQYAMKAVVRHNEGKRRWRSGQLLEEWLHRKHNYLKLYQQNLLNSKSQRAKIQVSTKQSQLHGTIVYIQISLFIFLLLRTEVLAEIANLAGSTQIENDSPFFCAILKLCKSLHQEALKSLALSRNMKFSFSYSGGRSKAESSGG